MIILEDDASGTYDVAHWSPEAAGWVGENDEPSRITPSHWYPMQGLFAAAAPEAPTARTQANRRSQLRLGFAISIVTTVAIGALVVALQPRAEGEQARAQVATQDAAQITQAVEISAPEARQSLKNEQRSEASANEFAVLNQEVGSAHRR